MIIDGRPIGPGYPCYIIAEMSANHLRDFDRAMAIVRAAHEARADAIKLQTYRADTLTIDCDNEYFRITDHPLWAGKTLYELYDGAYTPWEWHAPLMEEARRLGITCFSSPFNAEAVDYLEDLDVPAHKVASLEMVDVVLLRSAAATGKPIMMSVGMASMKEIEQALEVLREAGVGDVALLKCNSNYPANPAEINLRTIPDMAQRFGLPVGLSDHTTSGATAVAAVALGACIVEKHFAIAGNETSPDAAFSMETEAFGRMVEDIRLTEQALGKVSYGCTPGEGRSMRFRRSLFAVEDITAGETITAENVRIIRPGDGLSAFCYDEILGRKAAARIARGTPISWDLIEGGQAR